MNFVIEKASINDASFLAELKINIWKKVYKNILPDSYLDNLSKEERKIKYQKELSNESEIEIYLLKYQQNTIGTLRIKYYQDEKNCSCASIEDLYILPQYHMKGFGGRVMKFTVNQAIANHCKFLTAWILESNQSVRKMAIKYGFIEMNKARIHIDTNAKLIQYCLQLNQ